MLGIILIVLLVLILLGGLPHWSYAENWGYGPSGAATVALIVVILLVLTGRL